MTLTTIDLRPVSRLQVLYLEARKLTTIDLSPVPMLQDLYLVTHGLTTINLLPVPNLKKISLYPQYLYRDIKWQFLPNLEFIDSIPTHPSKLALI